jgi:hypothetical protein
MMSGRAGGNLRTATSGDRRARATTAAATIPVGAAMAAVIAANGPGRMAGASNPAVSVAMAIRNATRTRADPRTASTTVTVNAACTAGKVRRAINARMTGSGN